MGEGAFLVGCPDDILAGFLVALEIEQAPRARLLEQLLE
jgi:hypothetical protein